MKRTLFCFMVLLNSFILLSQTKIDTAALKKELRYMQERDQKVRHGDSAQFMNYIDSTNLMRLKIILDEYGWPGRSFVENQGNYTVWLIMQHADLKTQEKYLPLMKASVEKKESREVDLVYLEDRVLMRQGKKQIYGTQIWMDQKTGGAPEFWPIEDETNVDVRRLKLGLEPIAEYAKHFGIEYKAVK